MARIDSFEELPNGDGTLHQPVECGFKIFTDEGKTIVQLDTYGSSDRKLQGKVSQSIQLDEAAAAYLFGILKRTFPRLKE